MKTLLADGARLVGELRGFARFVALTVGLGLLTTISASAQHKAKDVVIQDRNVRPGGYLILKAEKADTFPEVKIGGVPASPANGKPSEPSKEIVLKVPEALADATYPVTLGDVDLGQPVTVAVNAKDFHQAKDVSIKDQTLRPGGVLILRASSDRSKLFRTVRIGEFEATPVNLPIGGTVPGVQTALQVPANIPPGTYKVTLDGIPLEKSVFVAAKPVMETMRATAGSVRGVLAGRALEISGTFNPNSPPEMRLKRLPKKGDPAAEKKAPQTQNGAKAESQDADRTDEDNDLPIELSIETIQPNKLVLRIPSDTKRGRYQVLGYETGSDPQIDPAVPYVQVLRVEELWVILAYSAIPMVLVVLLVGWLCYFRRPSRDQAQFNVVQLLFLEPQNKTYSLSRAQFIAWLAAISSACVFVFVADGLVNNHWAFPPLSGFAYTFSISLLTLVLSQATTSFKGAKGAGEENPSPADLLVHGGVLALERVQQVVWTIIGIGGFLVITVKNYASSNALPEVPAELLTLMGLSSAGYLGGKLARKPGPIIKEIVVTEGSVVLKIHGDQFSKNASVWIDGSQQSKESITVLEADAAAPNEFAKSLQVKLLSELADWRKQAHSIIVINADGQRAEWNTTVPKITAATHAIEVAGDKKSVVLTVNGIGIKPGAELREVIGSQLIALAAVKQDEHDPNKLQATLSEVEWPYRDHDLTISNPDKSQSSYHFVAAARPAPKISAAEISPIDSAKPEAPRKISISAENARPGAELREVTDTKIERLTDSAPDPDNLNKFTATVTADWAKASHRLQLSNPPEGSATSRTDGPVFEWKPKV